MDDIERKDQRLDDLTLVKSIQAVRNSSFDVSHVSDADIARFIRQHQGDVKTAAKRASLVIPFRSPHESPELMAKFLKIYAVCARASTFHGYDKVGNAVHFERVALLKPGSLKQMFRPAQAARSRPALATPDPGGGVRPSRSGY